MAGRVHTARSLRGVCQTRDLQRSTRGPIGGALVATLLAASGQARAEDLRLRSAPSRCEEVELGGELGTCDASSCLLTGAAWLRCDDLQVWADEIEVRFDEEGSFAGAEARGSATVVDRDVVVTCERVTVGPDRIRGRVEAATLRVKQGAHPDAMGIPQGRDTSILTGDIERPSPRELRVLHGTYTTCDCGADPPSWRIDSPEIEVELGERALIWWPMLYVNAFDLVMVPVTPPLAPVSIPLRSRALGFLPPALTFFGPWPMLDLPFFIPLGDAWDVTLAPGIRTDWIRNHDIQPARWGAPRLGARVRYAPVEGLSGELRAQWTWDRRLYVASQYFLENDVTAVIERLNEQLAGASDAQREAIEEELRRLRANQRSVEARRDDLAETEHRIAIQWRQDLRVGESLRWLVDAEWLGDDTMPSDFALTLSEQVVNYVPSRTQLAWTPDGPVPLVATAAADYLLVIGPTGRDDDAVVNWRGAELHSRHRGPALRVTLLPTAPFAEAMPAFHVDADATLARYGSWYPEDPAGLWVGSAEAGAAYERSLGPVSLRARASGHALWGRDDSTPGEEPSDIAVGFARLSASATTMLARRYGDWLHTVTPEVSYAGVPAVAASEGAVTTRPVTPEERLEVDTFQQLSIAVRQRLWSTGGAPRPVAGLTLRVPIDLNAADVLGLAGTFSWNPAPVAGGNAWIVVDPRQSDEPAQEVGTDFYLTLGPASLAMSYVRLAPTAERFSRTIYALAGVASVQADPVDWVHAVTPSATLRLGGFTASYGAVTLLPLPGDVETTPPRPLVSQHRFGLGYVSSCDCWDVTARATVPGYGTDAQVLDGLRVQVLLSIGGYAVGNQP